MALAFGNPRPFASEASALAHTVYNTALEHHLRDTARRALRGTSRHRPEMRPIREIVGVDPVLNRRWSARRACIESRQGGAGGQVSARSRPAADAGGDAASGAAGDLGDPGRQARTPQAHRAADYLAEPGRPGTRRPDAEQAMVSKPPIPRGQDQPESTRIGSRRRPIKCSRRWRNTAPPGRSGTYTPKRNARSGRRTSPPTSVSSWSTCSSPKCSAEDR